jgi:predicted ATP-binding protein involved in virulence
VAGRSCKFRHPVIADWQLDWLEVQNYRRFERLKVEFEPDTTVIVARNGGGKSAMLDAASRMLGPYVAQFGGQPPLFTGPDVHRSTFPDGHVQAPPKLPMCVSAGARHRDDRLDWHIAIENIGKRVRPTSRDARPMADLARRLREEMAEAASPVTAPVFASYGTGRLWNDDTTRKEAEAQTRERGYDRCLSAHSSSRQLVSWMRQQSFADYQDSVSGRVRGDAMGVVGRACDLVLEPSGWSALEFDPLAQTITAFHPDLGRMPFGWLSDGVRSTLALVADLAFRCYLINPHLGPEAAIGSPGTVLIDEVDLHLHPEWQFKIVPRLQQAFPRLQLIVTTHSPQVLSSVEGRSLRILDEGFRDPDNGSAAVRLPGIRTLGRPSYELMEDFQAVKVRPDNDLTRQLSRYTAMVGGQTVESDAARELRRDLERDLGVEDEALTRARTRLSVPPLAT